MIDDCTALILAGGDSRRMGCDKTSLEFAGKTLLQRAVEVMQVRFPHVVVSVRQRRAGIEVPQVCDEIPDAGPLAGMCAGLEWAQARQIPWVFAMAADMPFLNPLLIELLAERRGDCQAVVPVVQGHPQPLAAFYSVAALTVFREILAGPGKRSLRAVLERLDVCRVNEVDLQAADPGLRSFFDLDTPEDVALALRAISKKGDALNEKEYLSVGDAQEHVLRHVSTGGAEEIQLEQALGRVLAEDVRANRDQPPFDVSAMDGFAVRSADLVAGGAVLTVIEDIKAGDMPGKTVLPGQCARIMTGAPVPPGADAVIRVEDTQPLTDDCVEITVPVKAGNDIRVRGENMRNGDVVLEAGTEIAPGVIGVLATVKRARLRVYRRPRVAILSSGDELEALVAPFDASKIPESNSYALMAQLQALGIEPVRLGIARDTPDELARFLKQGLDYDVLLVSGGSSVGVHDHVRPTLAELGVSMHFWRVDMRPGHPVAFGTRGDSIVFCLPGNPVSSMVCCEQFVVPAVRRMMGHPRLFRRTVEARLTHPVKHRPGRAEFIRVTLAQDAAGGLLATSTGSQSSGDLTSMARADGLLVVPEGNHGLAAGDTAQVQLLDGGAFQNSSGFVEGKS